MNRNDLAIGDDDLAATKALRHCHVKRPADAERPKRGFSRRRSCILPHSKRISAILLERCAIDQMALEIRGIVYGGVDVEETLSGAWGFEALHLSLSSSHRLM